MPPLCGRWMTIVISNSRRTAGLPVPVWFYLDLPKGEPLLYHVLSPFPPSSNRKRKWWRYFHPRVLKPGNAASGPPETEIDCFSHATSPEIDQMAPPLHRKWKHSTGKWTSGPRLSDTKKDLVSLSVCSTDCRVMFEESGVEIPSRKLPCLPSFLCPPLPQPIPNHSIVISIKKVCISLDATTLLTIYLCHVQCTMYPVSCTLYLVPRTLYHVLCTLYPE